MLKRRDLISLNTPKDTAVDNLAAWVEDRLIWIGRRLRLVQRRSLCLIIIDQWLRMFSGSTSPTLGQSQRAHILRFLNGRTSADADTHACIDSSHGPDDRL